MRAPLLLSTAAALVLACAGAGPGQPAHSAAGAGATADSPDAAARRVVESFHAVLLAAMQKSQALGFEGRRALMEVAQQDTFDVPAMAHASILRGWKRLGEPDRSRWVALMRAYWAARYAHEYRSFSGERFETLRVETGPAGDRRVHATLVRPAGDDVELEYQLQGADGAWRIVELGRAGQPGEVRRLRAFHYAVLERQGFEALVAETEARIAAFGRE